MWLPKDERRLLAGYVKRIDVFEVGCCMTLDFVIPYVGRRRPYRNPIKELTRRTDAINRINFANENLQRRGFIEYHRVPINGHNVTVSLKFEGYEAGRRYQTFLGRLDAWIREQQSGLGGLILSFVLGGVLSGVIVGVVVAKILGD